MRFLLTPDLSGVNRDTLQVTHNGLLVDHTFRLVQGRVEVVVWLPAPLPAGAHTFTLEVEDLAGNRAAHALTFTILALPEVTQTEPEPAAVLSSAPSALRFRAAGDLDPFEVSGKLFFCDLSTFMTHGEARFSSNLAVLHADQVSLDPATGEGRVVLDDYPAGAYQGTLRFDQSGFSSSIFFRFVVDPLPATFLGAAPVGTQRAGTLSRAFINFTKPLRVVKPEHIVARLNGQVVPFELRPFGGGQDYQVRVLPPEGQEHFPEGVYTLTVQVFVPQHLSASTGQADGRQAQTASRPFAMRF